MGGKIPGSCFSVLRLRLRARNRQYEAYVTTRQGPSMQATEYVLKEREVMRNSSSWQQRPQLGRYRGTQQRGWAVTSRAGVHMSGCAGRRGRAEGIAR